jgi:hypothetical protein
MELSNPPQSKEEHRRLKAIRRAEKAASQGQKTVDIADNEIGKVTVLCVKFGTKYGREYIERLRNMVSRHLTVPYEFVCLTDDHHPIEGVRSIVQPMKNYKKIWWHKVHMFDPNLPINGRIVYFDLDVVIHNNIDNLTVGHGNTFLGIKACGITCPKELKLQMNTLDIIKYNFILKILNSRCKIGGTIKNQSDYINCISN